MNSLLAKAKSKKKRNWKNVSKPKELRKELDEVSLGKDKDGYFVYTHRARCTSYPTPHKIPKSKIKFISSTGNDRRLCGKFLIALADELDEQGKPRQADIIDEDFEEFIELLENGELSFGEQFSGEPRDPRGPYSNLGSGLTLSGVPGPQADDGLVNDVGQSKTSVLGDVIPNGYWKKLDSFLESRSLSPLESKDPDPDPLI